MAADVQEYFPVGQAGDVVCAGAGVPENIEPCVERRYFSKVHYLALVCDDLSKARLLSRPLWRNCHDETFIEAQVAFNQWFKEREQRADPRIELLDTTLQTVEETARAVVGWSSGNFTGYQVGSRQRRAMDKKSLKISAVRHACRSRTGRAAERVNRAGAGAGRDPHGGG